MRLTIDAEKCQGHGRCVLACPELFDLDDDGKVLLLSDEVPEDLEEFARRAVANCPERVIIAS